MNKFFKIILILLIALNSFAQEKNKREKIIENIIKKELPECSELNRINWWQGNILKNVKFNLILTYIPEEYSLEALLSFYNIHDEKGKYEKIVEYTIKTEEGLSFGSFAPSVVECKDINADGILEIWLSWSIGAVRPINNDRFLKFDYQKKEISPLEISGKNSKYFTDFETGWSGSTGGMWAGEVFLEDIDRDGKYEILKLDQHTNQNIYEEEKLKVEKWEIDVYKWDGNIYKYDDKLSLNQQSKKIPSWVKKIKPEVFPFEKK